jgi:hypothetical protein
MWCASFGFPETNDKGFGGKDCRHKTGTPRCSCCRAQVKLALEIGRVDFMKLIREASREFENPGNVYRNTDGFIRSEIEKPVLARIQQKGGDIFATDGKAG